MHAPSPTSPPPDIYPGHAPAYRRFLPSLASSPLSLAKAITRMCGWSRADDTLARCPSPSSSFNASLTQKWLPYTNFLVASSSPKRDANMARDANFPMILVRRLEREPHHNHLARTFSRHHHLPHPGPAREGAGIMHQGMFATFIGIPDNAIADSIVHSNTRRTPTHNPAKPITPAKTKTKMTPQTQLWNISQRIT